jgi:hypothetical protein
MSTTIVETFQSGPAKIRAALRERLEAKVPQFAHLLEWNKDGTKSSGSKLGAKGSIELIGDGPTTLTMTFSIGFPASLKISEERAARVLREELKELKSRVP